MEDPQVQARIDALVADFYSAFDNRAGATPRLADLVKCFTDKATIVRRSEAGAEVYTVEEFALPRIELLTQGALLHFHEWETSATTGIFDGICNAHIALQQIRPARWRRLFRVGDQVLPARRLGPGLAHRVAGLGG